MLIHKHHIIPRHAGGTDDPENLIELTVSEHAEAHRILYEKYGNENDRIAWLSLSGLINKEEARRLAVKHYMTGRFVSAETREKIRQANLGKKASAETKKKMSESRIGKSTAAWQHKAITTESNAKRSATMKGMKQPTFECPHCGKIGKANAMKRWHFDSCKEK